MKGNSLLRKINRRITKYLNKTKEKLESRKKFIDYKKKYNRYAFSGIACSSKRQYEAVITRWYHTIEKGLAYTNFRAGFGANNLEVLIQSMGLYVAEGYSTEEFFYKTALSVLHEYIVKNKEYGFVDDLLVARVASLLGTPNADGGVCIFTPSTEDELSNMGFKDFLESRHSLRHFSNKEVDIERLKEVVKISQLTPSACNRQGWITRIISDKELMKKVLEYQNGNSGFGHEFDKLILITADLRCFNKDRELFQAYIDGGMFAENILNSLHYCHIASVPLSASLTSNQEKMARKLLGIDDYEVFIMYIGVGDYPDVCQSTKSTRREPELLIY